jgi:predicted dehydrogenase
MAEISLLIVGCGSIGERHVRCFQKTNRVKLYACDNDAASRNRISERYGIPCVSDWENAVGTLPIQGVVICTPAPLHIPMALHALKAGHHVLLEKPLSHSLDGVEALLQARDLHQRQVAVAYVYNLYPWLSAARSFLLAGSLGPIRQASFVGGQPFHLHRPSYANTYYRDRQSGGGAIQDALTHAANWTESVLGPTQSVLCDCAHLVLPQVTVEDTVHVSARHEGALASYSLNQFQAPNESSFQLNAAEGSVRVELHNQRWGVFRTGESQWTWHPAPLPADRDSHFIAQANSFLDQIQDGTERLCSLERAAQTLRFNLAALASSESNTRALCQ